MAIGSAIIGAGASLLGSRSQRRAQQDAINAATTELAPFSVTGPGGLGVDFGQRRPTAGAGLTGFGGFAGFGIPGLNMSPAIINQIRQAQGLDPIPVTGGPLSGPEPGGIVPSGQGINIDLGDLEPIRGGLVNFGQNQLGNLGGSPGLDLLTRLTGGSVRTTGQGFQDALTQGFQTGLQDQLAGLAGGAFGDVGSAAGAADRQLQAFRAAAQPANQRAVNSTLQNLFNTGRLGTTGGANIIGSLAEAQNRQDLDFQLAAGQEGRAAQQIAFNLGSGFLGNLNQTRGLQDQLLQSAFGRFNQTQGLAADLIGRQQQFRGGELGLLMNALQGQGGLFTQGLDAFQAALAASQAQANARVGAGSNIARIASGANFGASPLTGIGNALLSNAGNIGSFFERFRQSQQPDPFPII